MAAGAVQVAAKDAGGTSRNVNQWSSDATLTGNLSPMIHAVDGEIETIGAKADTAYAGSGSAGLVGLLKGIYNAAIAALSAGENIIGKTGGISAIAGATITRPANTTAYASGQLVSFSTTAATVNATPTSISAARVNAGTGAIRRVRLSTNKTGLAGTEVFRVHLFKSAPTVTNGDGGTFAVNGVAALHMGYADVTLDRVFNDGSKGFALPAVGSEIVFDAGAGTQLIYALIEARGAYTPASGEVLTIALEILQD